jgi:diguanylate cyclase (GGDEF)-like protein
MLGSDSTLHGMLSMCLVTMALYLCVMVSFFYSVPAGLVPLSAVLWLAPGLVLGATVPYLLVRNRVTAHWSDPSLIVPQMLWATFLLTVGFVLIPKCREFPLQEMCVVMVFGFIDLRPRQAMTVGVTTTLMLTLAYGAMLYVMPADFEPVGVGMQVISTAYIMMLLTLQSRNFAIIREASKQEKRELTAATEQVRQMMTHDGLTGLYNRQHMQGLLERECERHLRSGQTFCVALIDLDHFKQINDQHGHQVGDEALIGFAKAAQTLLRGTDAICRWGGEEFLVLYTETSPEWHGFKAADRLREHVAAQRLCPSASHLQVTLSAGVAERRPEEPLVQLLERADQALYAAKAQGRNRCVVDGKPA